MSKIKTAIFVEGRAETIFVRNFLEKILDCQVSIICYEILTSGNFGEYSPSTRKIDDTKFEFTIYEVGNDAKVPKNINEREKFLIKNDFRLILGLRDIFSKEYHKMNTKVTDNNRISEFMRIQNDSISKSLKDVINVNILFAIMEIEAWFIGLIFCFHKLHPDLSLENIEKITNMDFDLIDPETNFYKPSKNLTTILNIANINYSKNTKVFESIVSLFGKEELEQLYTLQKCDSYNKFYDTIIDFYLRN